MTEGRAAVRRRPSGAGPRGSSASTRSGSCGAASRRTSSPKLRRAYRVLLVSKLNTTRALAKIEADRTLACDEVRYLVGFIRSSTRGVILRRPARRDGRNGGGRIARSAAHRVDCRQRALPVSGPGRRSQPRLRRDRRRDQGRGLSRDRGGRDRKGRSPRTCTGSRSGSSGSCIKILESAGASEALMAGQVKHAKIFANIVPDLTLLSVISRLGSRNTDALIAAVADVLKDNGITLVDSTAFLNRSSRVRAFSRSGRPTGEERGRLRVRLQDGGRDRRARHRSDDRGQAAGGRRRRGDGRDRRGDRPRRAPRRAGRERREGREAEPGHAVRRAGRRPADDSSHASRRRVGALDRCREDARLRRGGVPGAADDAKIAVVGRKT